MLKTHISNYPINKIKLDEILKSPLIEIYSNKEFERENSLDKRKIINPERHKHIVDIAHKVGIFDLFRKQLPYQNSHSLWFFKQLYDFTQDHKDLELYAYHVNNFEWKDEDKKYSSYLNHWISLYENLKNNKYHNMIRNDIDHAFSFILEQKDITKEIIQNRRSEISHSILFGSDKTKVEEAKINYFKEPSIKEIEEVINRLFSLKLSRAFLSASKLYSISENIEDLVIAVNSYNKFFECENESELHNFFSNAKDGLEVLLKTSKRNFIREEYKTKALEQAKEDWMVGTAFDDLKNLFLMTRLKEDKDNVDKMIERGINLLKKVRAQIFQIILNDYLNFSKH